MPASFAIPASIPIYRRNPVRVPERNFLVVASDAPVLACTFYGYDTDPGPLDVSDAAFQISLYRDRDLCYWPWFDYGWDVPCGGYPVSVIAGLPIDPMNGRVDFPLAVVPGNWTRGRMRYELAMMFPLYAATGIGVPGDHSSGSRYAQGTMTVLGGIIEYRPGAQIVAPVETDILAGIGVPT